MGFWNRLLGLPRKAAQPLPFDGICRDSMGIGDAVGDKPAVSQRTVEMMARARKRVDQGLHDEMARAVEGPCVDGEIDRALARSKAAVRLAEMKVELGIDSLEQPDLIQRGRAAAEGGCERSERWA